MVKGRAVALAYDVQGKVTKNEQEFTAIPYYAWANRGRGQMMVWFPETEADARPAPYPTIATSAQVTVSGKSRKSARMINDGEEPASSSDPSSYFDWWPTKGTTEWVEYAFEKPATVSECQVYWFDDTGHGEVRVPASWRLLYKEGNEWKPVTALEPMELIRIATIVLRSSLSQHHGLRLEITMQPKWSAGIQEWKVK